VDRLVEAIILEKRAVSIFRADMMSQVSEGPFIYRVAGGEA
jgi:hypothetical protein